MTVAKVHGQEHISGVTVCSVDSNGRYIEGTEKHVECDSLILSVGLIPENDILFNLNMAIDPTTGGPIVDQDYMTLVPGLFSCGNALIVNDLADYVSEMGEQTGRNAVYFARTKESQKISTELTRGPGVFVSAPQRITNNFRGKVDVYFRSADFVENALLKITNGKRIIIEKKYIILKPPEMERVAIEIDDEFKPEDGLMIDIESRNH
jgi:pyruvate/2-oxoglutarate dehydrogenase complex dihydrolipoamide dehydrogenase (E3) component